jgi:hypothetical protein
VDEGLRAELLARCEEDQRIRREVQRSAPGPQLPGPELPAEWRRIDEANTAWLTELTERVGRRCGPAGADQAPSLPYGDSLTLITRA